MKSKEINIDIEDVEDVLKLIETSYSIKFLPNEMVNLKTFGEISNHIISKIDLEENYDCTSQQSFYKLKKAITKVIGENEISPNTTLERLFPKKRRKIISLIERELNIDLKAFIIPQSHLFVIFLIFLISIIAFFFNWKYGLSGIIFTILSMKISDKTTTKFSEPTVGELAKNMMYENYTQMRKKPNTYNKSEVKKNLEMLFIKKLGLSGEFNELADDTILIT